MQYFFYIMLGLLPSLIWLVFYLRKDKHPEPNKAIIRIFLWGMLLAPLAVFLEVIFTWLLEPQREILDVLLSPGENGIIRTIIAATLIPATVEEYLKYAIVKIKILKNSVFDEPTDAMIYCLIAGLGFAAVENLLILSKISFPDFSQALSTMILRFLGATLVHALASAIVGYWLARSILYPQKRKVFVALGLALAILFHSCYNYFVINLASQAENSFLYFSMTVLLMVSVALLVSKYFKKLKKQQAVCLDSS